ncbi:hypothetical protein ACLOJK_031641 [Asimina triloba]
MAATLHAKINRRKLDKLNLINICEEILNPTVPMALRLSGILMGEIFSNFHQRLLSFCNRRRGDRVSEEGEAAIRVACFVVVDDVHRLLVEINEAWKVKSSKADPTVLPKGRTQASGSGYRCFVGPANSSLEKSQSILQERSSLSESLWYEAVTLRDDTNAEMEPEQILHHSFTTGATDGFQSFFPMVVTDESWDLVPVRIRCERLRGTLSESAASRCAETAHRKELKSVAKGRLHVRIMPSRE